MDKRNDALVAEMALRVWEDISFMEHAHAIVEDRPVDPVLVNVPEFRDYLLRYRANEPFAEEQFIPVISKMRYMRGVFPFFPYVLAMWIAHSKRIFRISEEMQDRFSKIRFGNLRLSDVILPFPIFGLQLAKPISSGTVEYGFSFVFPMTIEAPNGEFHSLNFLSLPQSIKSYGGLDPEKRIRAIKDLTHADIRRKERGKKLTWNLLQEIDKNRLHARMFAQTSTSMDNVRDDILIEEYIAACGKDASNPSGLEMRLELLRIGFNLCLYLQSLPPASAKEEGVHWQTEYLNKVQGSQPVISKRTEVCDIVGKHILDSMIVDKRTGVSKVGGWEADPQWRRAHTRRPPGKGRDPFAEKSVNVRHYLIREDRVPEIGVIKGTVSELR